MPRRSKSRSRSPIEKRKRRSSAEEKARSPTSKKRIDSDESRRSERRRSRSPTNRERRTTTNGDNDSSLRRQRWPREEQRREGTDGATRRRPSWRERNEGGQRWEGRGRIGDREKEVHQYGRDRRNDRWRRPDDQRFRKRSNNDGDGDDDGRQKDTKQPHPQGEEVDDKKRDDDGQGGYRGRRNSRQSDDSIKQVIVNPTEVPKSNKYFTHDDREMGRRGSAGSRRPRMLTPMKWGHDMFDKMTSEETTHHDEEGTPPLEEKIIDRIATVIDNDEHDPLELPQEVFQDLDLFPGEAEV